jgi:hypothetical protein
MPITAPVFDTTDNQEKTRQIVNSLVGEGIVCVMLRVSAKGAYPKKLKNGVYTQELAEKAREMNLKEAMVVPFPALSEALRQINLRVSRIKSQLVKGYDPDTHSTRFFSSLKNFELVQQDAKSLTDWLAEEKIQLKAIYPTSRREWEAKIEAMIAFMREQRKLDGSIEVSMYSTEELEAKHSQWLGLFPEYSAIDGLLFEMKSFPISSINDQINNEMVKYGIESIYSSLGAAIESAAEEVQEQIANCFSAIAQGKELSNRAKLPFRALQQRIENLQTFLYQDEGGLQEIVQSLIGIENIDLAGIQHDHSNRLEEIRRNLRQLEKMSKPNRAKASHLMSNPLGFSRGHRVSIDTSVIPNFD